MAPTQFFVRLQCGKFCKLTCIVLLVTQTLGIVGGFAPPTPSEIHIVEKGSDSDDINIQSMTRASGTSDLTPSEPKTVAATKIGKLIDELESILKNLPTESPPGSEDIYGLDTSIAWGSDEFEWYNGGPQGCGGGESHVQPPNEQKEKFKRAVEIVRTIAGS
jgi:hypothetical protein